MFEYPQPLSLPRTGTKRRRIIDGCIEEMIALGWKPNDPHTQGKPTSVRFLFYRLEAREIIPKEYTGRDGRRKARQPHQDVSDAMTILRYQGVFPLDSIIDETGGSEDYRGSVDMVTGTLEALERVRLGPWPDEPPELWAESRSLAGVIRGLAWIYRVPLVPLVGQASVGLLAEVAERVATAPPIVWYLGDYDLSGGHIEASAIERVEAFAGVGLDVHRLAITRDQVDELNLPVISKYDRRTKSHANAVETEALGQEAIEDIVSDTLETYWQGTVERWPTVADTRETERIARKAITGLLEDDGREG